MPFIVTTKRPDETIVGHGGGYIVSRRAVATLEEVKAFMREAVRDARWPSDVGGSNARQSVLGQIDDITASGGRAIRLPDGTIIDVEPVEWFAINRHVPTDLLAFGTNEAILAAYNAKQAA